MSEEKYSGAILSGSSLKKLIDKQDLEVINNDKLLSYEDLNKMEFIDETSISIDVGELFEFTDEIQILDIQGKYDLDRFYKNIEPDDEGGIIVLPQQLLLGKTFEKISTPDYIVGQIEERRTVAGNLGLSIKGFIPPGLKREHLRFTLLNNGSRPVRIYIGKTPPMKIIFQGLSSREIYRKGRDARVDGNQKYSGGAGLKRNKSENAIITSFSLNKDSTFVNKEISVSFEFDNLSNYEIDAIEITPIMNSPYYKIVSCSNEWELCKNNSITSDTKNFFDFFKRINGGRNSFLKSKLIYAGGEEIKGTFGIKFTKEIITQLKCNVKFEFKDDVSLFIKDVTESTTLNVTRKKVNIGLYFALILLFVLIILNIYEPEFCAKLFSQMRVLVDLFKALN